MPLFTTSRQYHEKKEETRQKIKMDGYSFYLVGKDFWVGPWEPGQKGHWQRGFFTEDA